ncbi:MAG: hemolysin III family protein [Bdellovibrionales bacterium]|nr:hemolysin III family protein [Bdellovibrionales bacterium]
MTETSPIDSKPKPLLRGHFHQAMFFVAIGACLPLILRCENAAQRIAVTVYSVCAIAMFGISSLYHRVTWTPPLRSLWKKLDHAGIYLMIAGTFTPISVMGLPMESRVKILITIWSVAFFGILQSIFFVNLPKYISAILYVVMGYLILPYLSELKNTLGPQNIGILLAGGIVYSLGAISYGLKRPVFNPQIFSYHEVFHLFVNAGAILHFIVISSLVH